MSSIRYYLLSSSSEHLVNSAEEIKMQLITDTEWIIMFKDTAYFQYEKNK